MLLNAKNGKVAIGDTDLDYICFGSGSRPLVMLPGLGDGFSTVRGAALPFAMAYREYARAFRVYVFSRKNRLEAGYSTRDMARDQVAAMRALDIPQADVLGVSQGGMIAQYVAIDFPQVVRRLVLAVTLARQNPVVQQTVGAWIDLALAGRYRDLLIDTAEKSYSERRLKGYRLLYPLFGRVGKPTDYTRFLIQARSCIGHDAAGELGRIACPTLVIGGDSDRIVGPDAAREVAGGIPHSELYVYAGLGHAAYEEAKDFNARVIDFLQK